MMDAIINACRLRLRPILMTSIAFCAGVIPLILGSGAGSEMRRAMGIAVFSGMVGVTLFGIFLTPVFYACCARALKSAARTRSSCGTRSTPPPIPSTPASTMPIRRRKRGTYEPAPFAVLCVPLVISLAATRRGAGAGWLLQRAAGQAVPAELGGSFVNAPAATAGEPVGEFWRAFHDPLLDSLVQRALKANTDVRSAAASLREVRALNRYADANLLPSVGVNAGVSRIRGTNDLGVQSTNNNYAAGFDVAWEADLFGRLGDARRAAQANVLAGAAGVRAAQVSVSAEVARNYFDLRGLQEQLRVAVASLETQKAALELVDARFEVGRGTALDTERARALVTSTAANIPALEAALIRTRYRLAVLCGCSRPRWTRSWNRSSRCPA
jgi:hypothetical protein